MFKQKVCKNSSAIHSSRKIFDEFVTLIFMLKKVVIKQEVDVACLNKESVKISTHV